MGEELRVAHVTDIHVQRAPRAAQLGGKRLLGAANLYVGGRRSHFTVATQQALARDLPGTHPDLVLCTGDLTALSTRQEFDEAHDLLAPVFSAQPTVVIPGNHDVYTRRAWLERRLEDRFGAWTGTGDWPRLHLPVEGVAVVAVDVCVPGLASAGAIDEAQLDGLDSLLADKRLEGRFVFVMLHYPLRSRRGERYGPARRALRHAERLEAVLAHHADTVDAILHGHEHHGFRTALPSPHGDIPILNPGAAGYAFMPQRKRTAHFCVYVLRDGRLAEVERYAFDGMRFLPEEGGAWATGG
ncbi:MAG: metallophosphoesterase [Alphaproteobacteria bacterium]|nr:metallophosphoesterase [Alphaproteobacteria bacterium]